MRLFLIANNYDITATQDKKYAFVISIAAGNLKYDEILAWLQLNTQKINGV
jgi:death-on-curing protein